MKSKMLLSALSLVLLLGLSAKALAVTTEPTSASEPISLNAAEKLDTSNLEEFETAKATAELTLDITPVFDLTTVKIVAKEGAEDDIKIKPIKNVSDNSGTFVAVIKDKTILTIDETGHWKALKAGETTFTLDYKYSQSAQKEISEKYPNYNLVTKPEKQKFSINVTAEKPKELDITPRFVLPTFDSVMVGETGTITVEPVEGISVTGDFVPVNEADSILSFDKQGNWKALKPGEKTIPLTFKYSDESIKKIEEKFPGYNLITKDIAQGVAFKIYEPLNMKLRFMPTTIEAQIGDTGKLTIEPIGGVSELTAVYNIVDQNGVIEIDKEGNWKAVKVGETQIAPVAELTTESLQRIKEKNPYGKAGIQTEEQQIISVKVSEKPLTTKKIDPKAITPSKKNLPKTSESGTSVFMLLGTLIIIGTISLKRKLNYRK